MAFGLMMLFLSCLCTYFYIYHLKPNMDEQLAGAKTNSIASAKAALLKEKVKNHRPSSLTFAEPGDFITCKDVGLNMLQIDGEIKAKHLFKNGLKRWYQIDIDQGGKIYSAQTLFREESYILLTLEKISALDLGIKKDDFYDINDCPVQELDFNGNSYFLSNSSTATYCHESNELEPEVCLVWQFQDKSGALALNIIRWQDSSFTIHTQVKVRSAQISILAS